MSDNDIAVERRGGAGSRVSGPACPEAAALGNGVPAVARGGRPIIARQGRLVSLPAPPPALHPSFEREKENRDTGTPAARKQSRRAAKRWLNGDRNCPARQCFIIPPRFRGGWPKRRR